MSDEMLQADRLNTLLDDENDRRRLAPRDASAFAPLLQLAGDVVNALSTPQLSPRDTAAIWAESQRLVKGAPTRRHRSPITRPHLGRRSVLGGAAVVGASVLVGYLVIHNRRAHAAPVAELGLA